MQHDCDQVLIEHALETPKNLEIALDIAFAFDKLRYRIIADAVQNIKARVLAGLNEAPWEVKTNFNHQPIPSDGYFQVRSSRWPTEYSVRLASDQRNAVQLYIGVLFNGDQPLADHNALQDSLAYIRPGKAKEELQYGWLWWDWLDPSLLNWSSKATLLKLTTEEARSTLAGELIKVAAAVNPVLIHATPRV